MYKRIIKRVFDIFVSLIALPFVIISTIILAPCIYLGDHGSIFYVAERVGKNGVPFKMLKFRSMRMNAPDLRNTDGSTFNSDTDTRVTSVGRIMRKASIDELPQFINVLLGHMSIIGPRPNLVTQPFAQLSPLEQKRLAVRPGISGYNQAYYRNAVTVKEKYINDCYYVDNMSFILDVKILLHTIGSVLLRKNINNKAPESFEIKENETVGYKVER